MQGIDRDLEYIRQAQNLVHHGLSEFLGFWPWVKGRNRGIPESIKTLCKLSKDQTGEGDLTGAGSRLPRFQSLLKELSQDLPVRQERRKLLAEVYCAFYNEFESLENLPVEKLSEKPTLQTLDPESYVLELQQFLGPIVELQRALEANRGMFRGAYLFGSGATRDFIPGWSDVDVLLILSPTCFRDADALMETRQTLNRLQKLLLHVDPLQLHGYFILAWADLNWYPQFFFPPAIFDYSVSLLDPDEPLNISVRNDEIERMDVFQEQVRYFSNIAASGVVPATHVERKLFFHKAFSFPLYFLQALGMHSYKKHSFAMARDLYPQMNWACLDKPSEWMRTRKNQVGIEVFVRRFLGTRPHIRARVLQSKPYRFLNIMRSPLWQVETHQFKELVSQIASLAESCARYVQV